MMQLEEKCRKLMEERKFEQCEKEIKEAMSELPHSAIPHNLMGILMEKKFKHMLAMNHFRAAAALDPTYIPARYNMELYGGLQEGGECAFTEADYIIKEDNQFEWVFDQRNVGHLVRKF